MQTNTGDRSSLIIGTRGSQLAMWQAEWIKRQLQRLAPGLSITLRRIRTSGDKIVDVPLAKIGGKGLFVKEIEEALLAEEIDLAVHSMKDVPAFLPSGLGIICVPEREDPRDALISRESQPLERLRSGSKVGTSSLRRQAQLLHYRSDLSIQMLRGNLDTRWRKLHDGHYDAIVLAAAGLKRLGWTQDVTTYLPFDVSLPAIGQGALGLEGRVDDEFVKNLVRKLDHPITRASVTAERALLEKLEGGCQVPIAGHATIQEQVLTLDGLVASVDGKRVVRATIQGSVDDARELGRQLAEQLLVAGGKSILNEIYGRV